MTRGKQNNHCDTTQNDLTNWRVIYKPYKETWLDQHWHVPDLLATVDHQLTRRLVPSPQISWIRGHAN